MASASIIKSLSAGELAELKDQVVKLLQSSDGHRMDLSRFKKEYKGVYRKKFDQQYGSLKSRKLKDVMAELDDVISLEENVNGVIIVLKLKVEASNTSVSEDLASTEQENLNLDATSEFTSQEVDLDFHLPQSSSVSSKRDETLSTVPGLNVYSPNTLPTGAATVVPMDTKTSKDDSLISSEGKISDRPMLKARRRVKKDGGEIAKEETAAAVSCLHDQESILDSEKVKELQFGDNISEFVKENATTPSPCTQPLSTADASVLVANLLPLSPPSLTAGAGHFQVTLPQVTRAGAIAQASPSLLEIMQQQEQEERLQHANEGLACSPFVYDRLLKEMQATPKPVKTTPLNCHQEAKDMRVREIGFPGPFEKSFHKAQEVISGVTAPYSKHFFTVEVNKAAEDIITCLSEEGQFVSLEMVKAKLCKQFGRSSLTAMGFKRATDIPALNDLIRLQNKVTLFVHAYVMSNSIATLYELGQSLADLTCKQHFEDLKLGPLLQQPVVYDMFNAPSSLPSPPQITTIQILKHLENYMKKEDLWRKKVDLKKFLEYLCKEHECETPYELGVYIQSIGLAISVIRQAKKADNEKWKAAREQVSADMEEEIQRHLRKIKKDLLGQERGDLRSCVMKVVDASPVDAMKEIFNCCLQLFEGQLQNTITNFFASITGDALGRHLFQLALNMSSKRLVGDALQQMVEDEVEKQMANSAKKSQENAARPVPPSEGVLVKEVKAWLANADSMDFATLANIEGNVKSKFPEFDTFEELGCGSFVRFLASHKDLLEAIEQVGGLGTARSWGNGTKFWNQVSLSSVLDFITQCGINASPESVEMNLCSYYHVGKVTDLGFGSCSHLLKKVKDRRKKIKGTNAPPVVYEAALMCHEPGEKDLRSRTGSVLGYMSKEDAIAAIQSTPLLEDVAKWTHWDEVYGGEVSKLGDLKSFLENEGILINAGKSSLGTLGSLVVMETSPGVLIRITTNTSPENFKDCACRGDAVGAAAHLVSMVKLNDGITDTPVALLANHVHSSLASMAVPDGIDPRSDFVLECLVRMPRKLAQTVGTKVFLEPLKKLVGLTEAHSLLLSSCSTHYQRSRLHQLGFVLGISQWIEDFQSRVSRIEEEVLELKLGVAQSEHQKRPMPVVQSSSKKDEQSEEFISTLENDMAMPLSDATIKEGEEGVSSDPDDSLQEQLSSLTYKQQEECRAVIEQIRREEFGIGLVLGEEELKIVQRQREREGRGLHRLSTELYSRDTHFVLELIQNADDNSYPEEGSFAGFPSLVFVLERDKIVVLNNEVGFMERNIRALCDVGKSTKGAHRYGYIGQKGIGFKSVFRVSDCPEVHSNGFHIRFDAKSGPIGYILPQWIEERLEEETECEDGLQDMEEYSNERERDLVSSEYDKWSTRFVLPLKQEHLWTEKTSLTARLRDVHPSLLLFLRRLRVIRIHDQVNNTRRYMIRKDLGDSIMEISHTNGTDRWLVVKKQLDASKIKESVEMTEIALAFPLFSDLDQDSTLGRRRQTLPQQNVFAYLPLRSYGFRFIIQGDFEVPSSREDVDSDKSWNQWLREEIPQLFIDALSVFMDHPSFSAGLSSVASYFQFVPLEEEILGFFTPVARHILTLLKGKPCIPVKMARQETISYEWVLPCKAIFCQDCTTQELITPALLKEHLGLCYLHSDIAPVLNPTLRSRLGVETLSSKHLLEIGKAEVKKFNLEITSAAADDNDRTPDVVKIRWLARWLHCVYRCLEQERNSNQDILDLISSLSVIPLTDGTFVNLQGDSVFLPLSLIKSSGGDVPKEMKSSSSDQTCFSVLERDLSTVHPDLFSSLDDIGRSQVEELLRRLGCKSWSARDLINSHIIPTFRSDKWKAKSNKVLRSYLVYILEQRLIDPSVCDVNKLRSCVQILTNKGALNPTDTAIHFTTKFGNAIDLARQLPSISWTLVDDSYLDSCPGSKARSTDWKAFLSDLGVHHFLSIKRKMVKIHRNNLAESPWASYEPIWQTTPDGLYVIHDCSCEEFEEFVCKMAESAPHKHRFICEEAKTLAQCIHDRWSTEYSQYADGLVHVKDTNGHILGEARSSFYLNLVSKPWMSASDVETHLFIPKDIFIRSELVERLFEDHVKYSAANLKDSGFISMLRIRESISVDDMINEMKKWSTPQPRKSMEESQSKEFTTSVAHMSEVYSFLFKRMSESKDERRKINEAFRKNALIFVPHHYPGSSSTKQFHVAHRLPGSFCLKKDVCWRDPTDVASKLLKVHGKVTTRHLLEGYYHGFHWMQQSPAAFFVDELNVDETPNVDEYVELASTVAEFAGFPTPSSLRDVLKIFSTLGKKCIFRGHNDMCGNINIDKNMAAFLKQSLEREEKKVFPSFGKWVSLSDKPLLADEKSLLKIFQNCKENDPPEVEDGKAKKKKKGVYFLDLGDLLQSQKQRSTSGHLKPEHEREEMKQSVLFFLEKICDVKALSKCIKKEFVPTLVQYHCVPLQKYFHQLMPHAQRFLYNKETEVYDELKRQKFEKQLSQMQFASVDSLETVYSLTTHPDIRISIKEKSGVQTVGSSFRLYVVQNSLDNDDVLNAEMVKLLLGAKKQGSSELHNFLSAVRGYRGSEFEFFLEETQRLEPLPDDEEPWNVPPPQESDIVEVGEEASVKETPTLHTHSPVSPRVGDNELHSWPPKSATQYDKTRKCTREPGDSSIFKMWPPPAPPDSMKDSQEENVQGRTTGHNFGTKRPNEHLDTTNERDHLPVAIQVATAENIPRQTDVAQPVTMETSTAEELAHHTIVHQSVVIQGPTSEEMVHQNDVTSALEEGLTVARLPTDHQSPDNENTLRDTAHINLHTLQIPVPGNFSMMSCHGYQARQIPLSQAYLWIDGGTSDLDFEDLSFNSDMKVIDRIPLVENSSREEIGRWGEQCVFEFLHSQAKCFREDIEVQIVWVNEKGNTTLPYDLEIRQRVTGVEDEIVTYVEVKTTSSDQKEIFEISVPELQFALAKRQAFHLYRVFNAGNPSCLRIRRLRNLAAHLEVKNVKLCLVT